MLVAAGLSIALPVWLGPDEGPHWQYAGFLVREQRLPDPERDDVFQGQHPPAYHALIGVIRPLLSTIAASSPSFYRQPGAMPLPAFVDLESDKVTPDPASLPSLAPSVLKKLDLSKVLSVNGFEVHMWRLIGIVFLIGTACVLFSTTIAKENADRVVGALAVATALLTPSFIAVFATPGNDQWAALFGSLGFALVVSGEARRTRITLASLLLAIGVAGKLTVLGPAIAAATWVAFERRTPRERLLAFACVFTAPFLVGITWVLRQAIFFGGANGAVTMSQLHASAFRDAPPDTLGMLDVVGRWLQSWIGEAGADGLGPGTFAVAVGTIVPVSCVVGSVWILIRGPGGLARRASASFLAGATLLGVSLALGNRQYFWIHGRYFVAMVLPGALAFAEVMKAFLGPRARTATMGTALTVGFASTLLLFGHVLPTYHPPRSTVEIPGLVAYVDAGSHIDRDATVRGVPRRSPESGLPSPTTSGVVDPSEVSIQIRDLPPTTLLIARITPWVAPRPESSVIDLMIDGFQVTGALSPELCREGVEVVVPTWASADGEIVVTARTKVGDGAGIAEVAIFELGVSPPTTRRDGDDLIVSFDVFRPWPKPRLALSAFKAGVAVVASAIESASQRSVEVRLPGCASADELRMGLADGVVCNFKLARFASQDAEVRGDIRSPGFDVVRIAPSTPVGTAIVPLFGSLFPEGTWTLRVLDAVGEPIPDGIVELVRPNGERVAMRNATVAVDAAAQAGRCGDLVSIESSRIGIDRILVKGSRGWSFPLNSQK